MARIYRGTTPRRIATLRQEAGSQSRPRSKATREERDTASPRVPDPYEKYQQESLDVRLAEEEPDRAQGAPAADVAGDLVDPDQGGGDVYRAEEAEADDVDEPGAEEAAIHIRDEDKV